MHDFPTQMRFLIGGKHVTKPSKSGNVSVEEAFSIQVAKSYQINKGNIEHFVSSRLHKAACVKTGSVQHCSLVFNLNSTHKFMSLKMF